MAQFSDRLSSFGRCLFLFHFGPIANHSREGNRIRFAMFEGGLNHAENPLTDGGLKTHVATRFAMPLNCNRDDDFFEFSRQRQNWEILSFLLMLNCCEFWNFRPPSSLCSLNTATILLGNLVGSPGSQFRTGFFSFSAFISGPSRGINLQLPEKYWAQFITWLYLASCYSDCTGEHFWADSQLTLSVV